MDAPIVMHKYFAYNRSMEEIPKDVNIAAVAELIGDPSRAAMLNALLDKRALPAGELAACAGISPQTASTHLARLVKGGLLTLKPHGRHRYYTLASSDVAHALEALALIAPPAPVRSLREAVIAERMREARTCYDHLAGKLGVGLTEALERREILYLLEEEKRYQLTETGREMLIQFGIDVERLQRLRRAFARPCLDWSERRYHLAGALGAALMERLFHLRWIERLPGSRALRVTEAGKQGLVQLLGEAPRIP